MAKVFEATDSFGKSIAKGVWEDISSKLKLSRNTIYRHARTGIPINGYTIKCIGDNTPHDNDIIMYGADGRTYYYTTLKECSECTGIAVSVLKEIIKDGYPDKYGNAYDRL